MIKDVYKIVSIADIHMGVLDPKYMYEQLNNQFVNRLINLDFDILAICGDIFDSKFMANNPIISYTLQLMNNIVNLCANKNATLIIIDGTASHDSGQLSLFYNYMNQSICDVRIVEEIKFEYVKGMKILCIPERYGLDEKIYKDVLFNSGYYDLCLLHGTFKGSFKGSEVATLKSNHAPVFAMNSFCNCRGPVLMGHYHIAGCHEEYAYYNGSPLRFRFGEEQEKGFLITLMNPTTRYHYTELIPIDSYIYNTININHILNSDPKEIIEYIKSLKEKDNIDFIRVQFNNANDNINIVRNYFRNSNTVKLQELDKKDKQLQQIDEAVLEQNTQYSFILDNNMNEYEKLAMYINQNEGYDFISSDELISLLEEGL